MAAKKLTKIKTPSLKEMKSDLKNLGGLAPMQLQFVYNYIENKGNATAAAIRAGYSEASAYNIGSRMLKDPKIQKKIAQHFTYKLEAAEVTFDWKIAMLREMANKCISGDNMAGEKASATGLVACIGELNKMQGDLAPEKHLHAHAEVKVEDVRKMIAEYQKEF